jgi:hypothetical protein
VALAMPEKVNWVAKKKVATVARRANALTGA